MPISRKNSFLKKVLQEQYKDINIFAREVFENYLYANYSSDGEIFIVFGGFYKLPGFGALGYSCCYKPDLEKETVKIPYESPMDQRMETLVKML